MKSEISISIGRGHLFRCMYFDAAWEQQCNAKIKNRKKFRSSHFIACALLPYGDQKCNIEIGNWETMKLKILIFAGRGHLFHCMCSDAA